MGIYDGLSSTRSDVVESDGFVISQRGPVANNSQLGKGRTRYGIVLLSSILG